MHSLTSTEETKRKGARLDSFSFWGHSTKMQLNKMKIFETNQPYFSTIHYYLLPKIPHTPI